MTNPSNGAFLTGFLIAGLEMQREVHASPKVEWLRGQDGVGPLVQHLDTGFKDLKQVGQRGEIAVRVKPSALVPKKM